MTELPLLVHVTVHRYQRAFQPVAGLFSSDMGQLPVRRAAVDSIVRNSRFGAPETHPQFGLCPVGRGFGNQERMTTCADVFPETQKTETG